MRLLLLLALVAALVPSASAQTVGSWNISLYTPDGAVYDEGQLIIPTTGETGTFGLAGQNWSVDLVQTILTITGDAFSLDAVLHGPQIPIHVAGTADGRTIHGTIEIDGEALRFTGRWQEPPKPHR